MKKSLIIIGFLILVTGLIGGGVAYMYATHSQSYPSAVLSTNASLGSSSTTQNVATTSSSTLSYSHYVALSHLYGSCGIADSGEHSSYAITIQPSNAVGVIATDPEGVAITPDTHTITPEEYLTEVPDRWYNAVESVNKDGRPIRITYSPNLLRGNYNLRVIPDEKESDKAVRFNLDVMLPNTCIRLASSTVIADIPKEGYTLNLFDINVAAVVTNDASSTRARFGFVSYWQRIAEGKARVTFEYIYPDSPASHAGLEKGDMVSTINGQSVITITSDQLNKIIDANNTISIVFTHANSDVLNTITITKGIPK
jgi:hypothetical protein